LGSVLLISVTASMLSAKTVAFSFPIIAVCFAIATLTRAEPIDFPREARAAPLSVGALLLLALLSASWAAFPEVTLGKVGAACAILIGTLLPARYFATENRANLLHMGEGVCIGFTLGVIYLFIELLT